MKFIDWNNHGREERKRQNQELLDLNLKSGAAFHGIITKIKESFFIAIFLQKEKKGLISDLVAGKYEMLFCHLRDRGQN